MDRLAESYAVSIVEAQAGLADHAADTPNWRAFARVLTHLWDEVESVDGRSPYFYSMVLSGVTKIRKGMV